MSKVKVVNRIAIDLATIKDSQEGTEVIDAGTGYVHQRIFVW